MQSFSVGPSPNRAGAFRRTRLSRVRRSEEPLSGSQRVAATCITHASLCACRGPLCPFALWSAFPTAVVGRHAHDYYEHSVTLGLAPRRPSRIPPRATSERAVGAPFVPLSGRRAHRPAGGRLQVACTERPAPAGVAPGVVLDG